ncbi:MAG: trehalose-phosphatase [Actinomycetota bacterium]
MADGPGPTVGSLPRALDHRDEIRDRLAGSTPAVFLDYDGTLTPIVERPEDALLSDDARRAIERLAARCPVAVISGRDLADVRRMVGVEDIAYAGSHGFDIAGPGGVAEQHGVEFLPDLDRAEDELRASLGRIPGIRVERKRFAIAVHVRQVEDRRIPEVETAVDRVARAHARLRRTGGKKVFELRPNEEWDKGRALLRLMQILRVDRVDVVPIYVGDDATDEDAFRAIAERGIGLVVQGEGDSWVTAARYSLADTEEVRVFLEELASPAMFTA